MRTNRKNILETYWEGVRARTAEHHKNLLAGQLELPYPLEGGDLPPVLAWDPELGDIVIDPSMEVKK